MLKQAILEAITIYHLLIVAGFVIACFITMENQFIYFDLVNATPGHRAIYLFGMVILIPFLVERCMTLTKEQKDKDKEMGDLAERISKANK